MPDHITTPPPSGGDFEVHPEGTFTAVCVDVIDLGFKWEQYQQQPGRPVHKFALVFQSGEVGEHGRLLDVSVEYTNSTNEKAGLRKFLQQWRGKSYTDDELAAGLPLHKLAGQAATITVEHKQSQKGRTYARIVGVLPPMKGAAIPACPVWTAEQRPKFWADRKQAYADQLVVQQRAAAPAPAPVRRTVPALPPTGGEFDDFPGSLDHDDDLPF